MKNIIYIAIALAIILGCSSKDSKKGDNDKIPVNIDTTVKLGSNLVLADFQLSVPDVWVKEKPATEMRVVQYFLKHYSSVNIIGFYFGNRPEMADANIERWKGEYTKVDNIEKNKLAGDKIIMTVITGTFKKRPAPMAEEFSEVAGYMTLAAIIPSFEGPYFFKMVGPKTVVEKEIPRFRAFLNSYKKFEMHGM